MSRPTHEQIWAWVHAGPAGEGSAQARAAWVDAQQRLLEIDRTLAEAMRGLNAGWEGAAAEAARQGLTPMGQWAAAAAGDAARIAGALDRQAGQAAWLRRTVPPPPSASGDRTAWDTVRNEGPRARAAAELMMKYEDDSLRDLMSYEFGSPPPVVTVEAIAPTTTAGGGVGAGAGSRSGGATTLTAAGLDPGAQGPGAQGPGAPGAQGPGTQGPGTQGPGAQGLGTQGPGAQGVGTQGVGTQGVGTQGLGTQGIPGPHAATAPGPAAASPPGTPFVTGPAGSAPHAGGAARAAVRPGTPGAAVSATPPRATTVDGGRPRLGGPRSPYPARTDYLGPEGGSSLAGNGAGATGGRATTAWTGGRGPGWAAGPGGSGSGSTGAGTTPPGRSAGVGGSGRAEAPRTTGVAAAEPSGRPPPNRAVGERNGMMPMTSGAGGGAHGGTRRRPAYLLDATGAFDVDVPYTDPVIGAEDPGNR